jgi:hypothetical protein
MLRKKNVKSEKFNRMEWPEKEITDLQVDFGFDFDEEGQEWFNNTLKKAEKEGITGYPHTKWEVRFSQFFYAGGEIKRNKKLSGAFVNKGWRLFMAIARSFRPKHEHKTAVCAMILRSLEG